jgi:rhodanese-related sulfurtransferase
MRRLPLFFLFATASLGWTSTAPAFTLSEAPVTPDLSLVQSRTSADQWPHINIQEMRRLLGQPGVVLLDARPRDEWEKMRIPGALSLPGNEFDKSYPVLRSRIIHARTVITYCHGYNCGMADYLAGLLAARGHRNLAVYPGGFPEWKRAGLPLEGTSVRPKHAEKRN